MSPTTLDWPALLDQTEARLTGALTSSPGEMDAATKADILDLLRAYTAKYTDFQRHVHYSPGGYTKNLVRELGHEMANVIVMCWAQGQSSAIHAHEGSKCFVKVLAGQLVETRVPHPAGRPDGVPLDAASACCTESILNENDVAYIDDSIGCHKVANRRCDKPAVTLHIYAPPYRKCRLFEPDELANRIFLERSRSIQVTFDTPDSSPQSETGLGHGHPASIRPIGPEL